MKQPTALEKLLFGKDVRKWGIHAHILTGWKYYILANPDTSSWSLLEHAVTKWEYFEYPERPSLPEKPWHPDGDELFTIEPLGILPKSDDYIAHMLSYGEINIGTGRAKPNSDGMVRGYPLNAAHPGDRELRVVNGFERFAEPGTLWINDGVHRPKGPIGEKIRVPKDAIIQGYPMTGYSDTKLHILDVERRTITEIQKCEPWPNGSVRAHSVSHYSLDLPSTHPDVVGCSAAKIPLAESVLRYDDLMNGWRQRTTMGTAAASRAVILPPAQRSDGRGGDHPDAVPMGAILTLKPEVAERLYALGHPQLTAVVECYERKGIMIVDTGSESHHGTSLEPDPRWDQDQLAPLRDLSLRDFVVRSL